MNITINDKSIDVKADSTILEATQSAGLHIPTLRYHKKLSSYGGCRVCVVAVENIPRLVALCTRPVTEGMVIGTDTAQIKKIRPPTHCISSRMNRSGSLPGGARS